MLQIKDIRKEYKTGDLVQTALDGVSLNFRESELVAILGPSGSGKSTMLNIIGGLDKYDSGDLIINGISTKKYTDRDWDSYRNHTVGFIFQSYNLISHQTILSNVELALTISGVPRSERRKRAAEALEKVGLGNQLHKKPNQLSGGQMQRVAIARALVNNPSILLADEPTGALDSETSIQVMDLLKDISKDRLVIMVTHNPELATEYADRIVRVKDGNIIDDSAPFEVDEKELKEPEHKNMGKTSMSFFSSLALSFNNLKSKKGRTLITAFAGSIGIIGIALILSLSAGFQNYIDDVQDDTLANNPLTLQTETADILSVITPSGGSSSAEDEKENSVLEVPTLSSMFEHFGSNDLAAFKEHYESNADKISHTVNTVQYGYGIKPLIYAPTVKNDFMQVSPPCLFKDLTGNSLISAIMDVDVFQEMIDNEELLNSQYQVLEGRWPEKYNEVVFVLPSEHQLSDHLAYALGMKDLDSLEKMISLLYEGETAESENEKLKWTYDELMKKTFKLLSSTDLYRYNKSYGVWEDMSEDESYMKKIIEKGEDLHVVGIVCPKAGKSATLLSPGVVYHPSLINHIIEEASSSKIVKAQLANPDKDVFSGKPFDYNGGNGIDIEDMITIDKEALSEALGIDMSESLIIDLVESYLNDISSSVRFETDRAKEQFMLTFSEFGKRMLREYVLENADEKGSAMIYLKDAQSIADNFLNTEYAKEELEKLSNTFSVSSSFFSGVYNRLLSGLITDYIESEASQFSEYNITDIEKSKLPSDNHNKTKNSIGALITLEKIEPAIEAYKDTETVHAVSLVMSRKMAAVESSEIIAKKMSEFGEVFLKQLSNSFYINEEAFADAFKLNMSEEELHRLLEAMSGKNKERSAETNLRSLGYADLNKPVWMSFYMKDFNSKEEFISFLEEYNSDMEESGQEEKVIQYNDMAGMMMDSIRSVINTVSYVLIALVAVSLLVSSIMIGIITYISVMERTKEIGLLRAMGASKHNVSQVFNAETFIMGLLSGLIGVVMSLILLIPGNRLIHMLIGDGVTAQLPVTDVLILVGLSIILTLLGGLIPSKQAAKKDPVTALRSE